MKEAKAKWIGSTPLIIQRYIKPESGSHKKKPVEAPPVEKLWLRDGQVQVPNVNTLM